MDIIATNNIFGIKDEMVSPYNEEIIKFLRLGLISSKVILRIKIAAINPTVNTQNSTFISVLKKDDVSSIVIDCNQ